YVQQRDEVLHSLHISLAEFTKCTHALLISLEHHNFSGTLEQWANHLLEFHKLYQHGAIPKSAQNTLQVDINLQDKLCALVDKIHTSPNLQRFEDPMDPMCSFHMQREEPIEPWNPVSTPVLHQQEELNVALNILKALNPTGGLFNQPAAHTIGLSARPHANFLSSTFCTWGQPAKANPHLDTPTQPSPTKNDSASTHTLFYINKSEAPSSELAPLGRVPAPKFKCSCPPHFDLCHSRSNAPPPCDPHSNPLSLCQPVGSGAP
ncbi:hypothetical protein C0993_002951, partial [Termitomyces sp. T159_Od127]